MAREGSALIGSGTVEQTRVILTPEQRGTNTASRNGHRTGTQVLVINPEDLNSVDAFVTSGVFIGNTATLIWGPNTNPLPRQRHVELHNQGPGQVFIGHDSSVVPASGTHVHFQAGGGAGALQKIELPLMHNVEIWAVSDSTAQIQILAY
jgi:hypothetical protein